MLHRPPGSDISPREAEVLALVGERLTNSEIGERLFISARTVETHVASLLRKLELADKRALAAYATAAANASQDGRHAGPLTSFVGRTAERRTLAKLIAESRLVTALGPGGVGKTRLAGAVVDDVRERFEGTWLVDLVPVTDEAMIAGAVSNELGIAEQPGQSLVETVATWVGDRPLLVVIDNCEHLVDGVASFAERLLTACPRLVLLATSRMRLMLPFETVYAVPGLSLPSGDDPGDAVTLFSARAGSLDPAQGHRVEAICSQLDGVPLAIELAASRLPSLGLDGLEAGLAEPLRVLAGSRRAEGRHQSLRATLDWSWSLLTEDDRALLEQVSVFAAPFTAADACAVVHPERSVAAAYEGLAALADNSLLVAVPTPDGMRYRALEEVRQYGQERLGPEPRLALHRRHLRWCEATGQRLLAHHDAVAFDRVVDDLRAALLAASARPDERRDAQGLAMLLGRLTFARGIPSEAMRRFEEAADLATDTPDRVEALQHAIGAAFARQSGADAMRLIRRLATLAEAAGDRTTAAIALAHGAETVVRWCGMFSEQPADDASSLLLDETRALGVTSVTVEAGMAVAESLFAGNLDAGRRALALAEGSGDPRLVSAAHDVLTTVHLEHENAAGAMASIHERLRILDHFPREATVAVELIDGYLMAADVLLALGDLPAASRYADELAALPFVSEQSFLTTSRQLRTDFFIGDMRPVLGRAEAFRSTWERAGRPVVPQLGPSAWAVRAAYGLRDDPAAVGEWREIWDELTGDTEPTWTGCGYPVVLDALVELHHGDFDAALETLPADPADADAWNIRIWRPWAAALWAEASALADRGDLAERLSRARTLTFTNPVAEAVIDRAAAIGRGDLDAVLTTAKRLSDLGCRYQQARSLLLAGRVDDGRAAMIALGISR